MNPDRTGPEPHKCEICGVTDTVPDIMPYLMVEGKGHVWCHPMCKFQSIEARRKEQGPLFPERHEPNDGQ